MEKSNLEKKIEPNWVATHVAERRRIEIGPYNPNQRYHGFYLSPIKIELSDFKDFEELAKQSGLEIVEEGYWDLDGICEYHYSFRPIKKDNRSKP